MSGIMLCGSSPAWNSSFLSKIVAISGVGGTRRSADAADNSDAGGFADVLYSCIARLKPFRVTISFDPHQDWKTALTAAAATWTMTWAVKSGYSTGATLAMTVGMTDITIGGTLEERMLAEVELTPSGEPTIVAGSV